MTLVVVADIVARHGREADLQRALAALVDPTRAEAGCVTYDLYRSTEEPGRFHFHEVWASRAAWDAHMASAHLAAFGAIRDDLVAALEVRLFEKIA